MGAIGDRSVGVTTRLGIGVIAGLVALAGCAGGRQPAAPDTSPTSSSAVTVEAVAVDLEERLEAQYGAATLACGMGDLFSPGAVAGVLQAGNALTCTYMSDD